MYIYLVRLMRKPTTRPVKIVYREEADQEDTEVAGHTKPSGPAAQTQFYLIGTLYAVTLNPCDVHQYILKPDRKTKIKTLYREILETCNCRYHFKLEFSEPRGMRVKDYFGPRLHFHGLIRFDNKEQLHDFLFKTYHMLCKYGSLDIDICNDPSVWMDYINKQKIIKDKISNCDFFPPPPQNNDEVVEECV